MEGLSNFITSVGGIIAVVAGIFGAPIAIFFVLRAMWKVFDEMRGGGQ